MFQTIALTASLIAPAPVLDGQQEPTPKFSNVISVGSGREVGRGAGIGVLLPADGAPAKAPKEPGDKAKTPPTEDAERSTPEADDSAEQPPRETEPGKAQASPEELAAETARQMAYRELDEDGLSVGYDPEFDRIIVVGAAPIAGDPSSPHFGELRSVAFHTAMLDAQRAMTEFIEVAVRTRIERTFESPESASKGLNAENGTPVDQIAEKAMSEAEAFLRYGSEEDRAAVIERVLARSEFKDAVTIAAASEFSALQVYSSYEQNPKDAPGTVSVICISSPTTRSMAQAVMGQASVPASAPRIPVGKWLRELDQQNLLSTHGVLMRRDEHGELNLLAFGQSTARGNVAMLLDVAYEEARLDAMQTLRQFVALDFQSQAGRERTLTTSAFEAKALAAEAAAIRERFEGTSSLSMSVKGLAESLKIHGVTPVHTWRAVHPDAAAAGNDRPTVGVVLGWKISSKDAAKSLVSGSSPAEGQGTTEAAGPANGAGKSPRKSKGKKGVKGDIE